jgi:hypothetical protein
VLVEEPFFVAVLEQNSICFLEQMLLVLVPFSGVVVLDLAE